MQISRHKSGSCKDPVSARGLPFFQEGGPPRSALPFPFSTKRKKQRSSGSFLAGSSCVASAQCPRAPPSLRTLDLPVCFTQEDQRPSSAASGLVSFGASEEVINVDVIADNSMSLAVSDAEEWRGSGGDPEVLPPSQTLRPNPDANSSTS